MSELGQSEQPLEHEQAVKNSHGVRWFNLKVILASLLSLIILSYGRNYIEFYLHADLAYLNQLSFAAIIYTGLIATVWNPVCKRLWQPAFFSSGELCATLLFTLAMVWASGSYPGHLMIAPHHLESGELAWQKHGIVDQIPPAFSPLAGDQQHQDYDKVFVNYAQGKSAQESIPWQHWIGPLSHWWPLYALFALAVICIAWLVHRQWSHNEQLTYPVAQICTGIFKNEHGRSFPDIFYSRMMWISALIILSIHCYGILITWFPGILPNLSFRGRFNFLWSFFPILNRTGSYWLVDFHLMFSAIGLAYFLGREVGLTLGLAQVLLLVFSIQYYLNSGQVVTTTDIEMSRSGAYLAYALIILVTGRHYYLQTLKQAFIFNNDQQGQAWIARIFLVSITLLYAYLVLIFQMDYLLALLFMLCLFLCVIAFSRLVCEIGGPYIQGQWGIGSLFINCFGPSFIGPAGMVSIIYISSALAANSNTALMPFISNGLQIADKAKLRTKKLFIGTSCLVLLAITCSMFFKTQYFYEYGAQSKHAHVGSFNQHIKNSLMPVQTGMDTLEEFNQIQVSKETSGLSKLSLLAPNWDRSKWMLFGAFGVLIFFIMRVRLSWFPLHPILFLVWNTFPIQILYWSFFIGWCCKEMVIRFGGGSIYQKVKPFFIGLIIGDILAFALTSFIAIIYTVTTGAEPEIYRVYLFF